MASDDRDAFGGRLPFGDRPALLVVDVVMAYLQPGSALYDPAFVSALAATGRLVAAARHRGVPVIFTNVVYRPGEADGGLFRRKVPALTAFEHGNPLGDFAPSLRPRHDETIVSKHYASAFFGTSLASLLTAAAIDTLVVAGFSTSGCVRASALDALQHGFAPFVVREACGDRHPGPQDAALFDLQAKYAEVVSEAEAIALFGAHRPAA